MGYYFVRRTVGAGNSYHAGVEKLGVKEREKTFSHKGQVDDGATMPKLSLHRSGLVRAHIGEREASRLQASPFTEVRGQLVASVRINGLNGMPEQRDDSSHPDHTRSPAERFAAHREPR